MAHTGCQGYASDTFGWQLLQLVTQDRGPMGVHFPACLAQRCLLWQWLLLGWRCLHCCQ